MNTSQSTANFLGIAELKIQAPEFVAIQQRQKKDVLYQLNESVNTTVEQNRQKLFPIVSSLLFCAMNNIAIRKNRMTEEISKNYFGFELKQTTKSSKTISQHLRITHFTLPIGSKITRLAYLKKFCKFLGFSN